MWEARFSNVARFGRPLGAEARIILQGLYAALKAPLFHVTARF